MKTEKTLTPLRNNQVLVHNMEADIKKRLHHAAIDANVTMNNWVIQAIIERLKREEKNGI